MTTRRYDIRVKVVDDWDDGSTMVDGYDTPTHPGQHGIRNANILLLHFKKSE